MRVRRAVFPAAALVLLVLAAPAGAQQKKKPAAAAPAASAASASDGGSYAQQFASVCAACHGANGHSEMQGTPSLAGQHSFYAITQLFLFREGRRDNAAMTAVAKSMKNEDMQGFADHIATLKPVAPTPPATPPDAERMKRGAALAQEHKCVVCHGADLSGGQQVPRIANQREEYLQASLKGFKDSTRAGYTRAMAEAVSQVPQADLDTLAYYVARFPGAK